MPAEESLRTFINFAAPGQVITATISIGTPGVGVDQVSFRLFDIDRAGNRRWVDFKTISGSLSGTSVAPILTVEGTSPSVSGNQVTGVSPGDNATTAGNVLVSFDQSIDQITVAISTGDIQSGVDPGNQGRGHSRHFLLSNRW